jgi:hypothetical protein
METMIEQIDITQWNYLPDMIAEIEGEIASIDEKRDD